MPCGASKRGHWLAAGLVSVLALAMAAPAQAQLFPDNEARKAIVDLRARVVQDNEQLNARIAELAKTQAELLEQLKATRLGLVDLNAEIATLRGEVARLRGGQEELAREIAELKKTKTDLSQSVDERLRRIEPQKVSVDGREFEADPAETRAFDDAMALLRGGNFAGAADAFGAFVQKHPSSGYADSARFWLGNALYGKKDYARAITVLNQFVAKSPTHPRAPEAMLAVANCQLEMKDSRAARTTLTDLQKAYPSSEAALAAKERLAALR
jgi:tol-pal system protein YbgF